MEPTTRTVRFAGKFSEDNYERLSLSERREDKDLFRILTEIREIVGSQYDKGEKFPKDRIPSIYKAMFKVKNLWRLTRPDGKVVFYSLVGDEIWIVDLV